MKITFKRIDGKYIVSIHFKTFKEAWEMIFKLRKEVA